MLEHYFAQNCHNIETRNNNMILRVPNIKRESTKTAFFYNGAVAYNQGRCYGEVWGETHP